jgi:hypothetical protein
MRRIAIEADHGRLKSRLRPMRSLKQLRRAQVISAGRAFIQNIRRGHYELGTEKVVNLRVLAAFDELALAIDQPRLTISPTSTSHNTTVPSGTSNTPVAYRSVQYG